VEKRCTSKKADRLLARARGVAKMSKETKKGVPLVLPLPKEVATTSNDDLKKSIRLYIKVK